MNKKLLLLCLLMIGCSTSEKYTGIVHDYIFQNALKVCQNRESDLHYIVSNLELKVDNEQMFPCREFFIIRCQDGTDHQLHDGIGHCFIPRSQLKESLLPFETIK